LAVRLPIAPCPLGPLPLGGVRFLDPDGVHRTPEIGEGGPPRAFSLVRQLTEPGEGVPANLLVFGNSVEQDTRLPFNSTQDVGFWPLF